MSPEQRKNGPTCGGGIPQIGSPSPRDGLSPQYGRLRGAESDLYREFAAKLEELLGEKIVLWDERRTTIEAHQILSDNNYHGKKRKKTVDAVAASLILEGYLNYLRTHKE